MSYSIGSYGFTRWLGDPPGLVRNHLRITTKPGQNGIAAQALGAYGNPFEVELSAAFADQATGAIAENGYRSLVANSPQIVVFNGLNYFTAYQHRYLVLDVNLIEFRRMPLLMGLGFIYYGGWQIRSRWLLQPIV